MKTKAAEKLRKTLAALPMSKEQYEDQEEHIKSFLLARGFDWTLLKQQPQRAVGGFSISEPLVKIQRTVVKYLSAEEQREERLKEMMSTFKRKRTDDDGMCLHINHIFPLLTRFCAFFYGS